MMSTILLGVALQKDTAAVVLRRTEAAFSGDYHYDDVDLLGWAEYSLDEWTTADCGRGAPVLFSGPVTL